MRSHRSRSKRSSGVSPLSASSGSIYFGLRIYYVCSNMYKGWRGVEVVMFGSMIDLPRQISSTRTRQRPDRSNHHASRPPLSPFASFTASHQLHIAPPLVHQNTIIIIISSRDHSERGPNTLLSPPLSSSLPIAAQPDAAQTADIAPPILSTKEVGGPTIAASKGVIDPRRL